MNSKNKPIRWLMFSSVPPGPTGGVEVHMKRVLDELNIQPTIVADSSSDLASVNGPVDVIHTHGSLYDPVALFRWKHQSKPVWIHTAHGLTVSRMHACREGFWPGGYLAAAREQWAIENADLLAVIHPGLLTHPLLKLRLARKKRTFLCGNGWDPQHLIELKTLTQSDRWIYVGREQDAVKNPNLLFSVLKTSKNLLLDMIPGPKNFTHQNLKNLGPLPHEMTSLKVACSRGLLLTSRYEGLPLVVLEALALGVPVVCTKVGGLNFLNPSLRGLIFSAPTTHGFLEAILNSENQHSPKDQITRATHNRQILDTWKTVTKRLVDATLKH